MVKIAACHQCCQTLNIDHMLLECAMLQECDEYYTADSLNTLLRDLHRGIPTRVGILLSDMNGQFILYKSSLESPLNLMEFVKSN